LALTPKCFNWILSKFVNTKGVYIYRKSNERYYNDQKKKDILFQEKFEDTKGAIRIHKLGLAYKVVLSCTGSI